MRSLSFLAFCGICSLGTTAQTVLPPMEVSALSFEPKGYTTLPFEERVLLSGNNQGLTFADGSYLWFPEGSLLGPDSALYEGTIRIQYRKIENPAEIWQSGIPMAFALEEKPGVLETGGMVELRVSSASGQPLMPNPNARPQLSLKTSALPEAEDMRLYRLDEETGNWQEDAPNVVTVRDSFQLVPRNLPVWANEPSPFIGIQFKRRSARHKQAWPKDISPRQAFISINALTKEAKYALSNHMSDLVVLNYSRKELRILLKNYRKRYANVSLYPAYRFWVERASEVSFMVRMEFLDGTLLEFELMPLISPEFKVAGIHKQLERKTVRSQRKGIGIPQGNYYYKYTTHTMDKDRHFFEDSILYSTSRWRANMMVEDSTLKDTLWIVRNGQQVVFRQMPLFGFGIINCDRPRLFPGQWNPRVTAVNEEGKPLQPSTIYMAAQGVNTLFLYYSLNDIRNLGLYRSLKQVLYMEQGDGELLYSFVVPSVFLKQEDPNNIHLVFRSVSGGKLAELLKFDENAMAMVKP